MGCHALLQGNFLTQGSNSCLILSFLHFTDGFFTTSTTWKDPGIQWCSPIIAWMGGWDGWVDGVDGWRKEIARSPCVHRERSLQGRGLGPRVWSGSMIPIGVGEGQCPRAHCPSAKSLGVKRSLSSGETLSPFVQRRVWQPSRKEGRPVGHGVSGQFILHRTKSKHLKCTHRAEGGKNESI